MSNNCQIHAQLFKLFRHHFAISGRGNLKRFGDQPRYPGGSRSLCECFWPLKPSFWSRLRLVNFPFYRSKFQRSGFTRQQFETVSQEVLLPLSKDTKIIPDSFILIQRWFVNSKMNQTCILRISIPKLCLVKPFRFNFDLLNVIFGSLWVTDRKFGVQIHP